MNRAARTIALVAVALAGVACGDGKTAADLGAPDMTVLDLAQGNDLRIMHCLYDDDAGVTHGCTSGGNGIGDHDDGGGLPDAPPPDASASAMNLPFGAECLNNEQCSSHLCFDFRVRGQFCTILCDQSIDCPSPPEAYGCNGQGICKVDPSN